MVARNTSDIAVRSGGGGGGAARARQVACSLGTSQLQRHPARLLLTAAGGCCGRQAAEPVAAAELTVTIGSAERAEGALTSASVAKAAATFAENGVRHCLCAVCVCTAVFL